MTSTPQASRTENNESVDSECALLSVSGVGFDYDNAAILEDVSLSAERGEFVALVGPSGCGKSTLLNLISGVLTAREGTIVSSGLVTRTERLGNISYMQQKDLLLPWRSVAGNSRMGLELRGIGRAESDIEVERLAGLFGLTDVIDSMPWQLSGGMRQRVALLRAVLPDNPVLLLDEPFGALDAITRRSLQQWLLVTHDVEEAILLADRVLMMAPNPGRIVAEVEAKFGDSISESDLSISPEFIELKKHILNLLSDQENIQ